MVLGNTLPVMAEENPQKEENVYASLEEDGTVSGVYVVNEYDLEKDTRITDYGDYTEVTNLTTEDKIEETADGYTVEGKKGKFYYQGNLETKELPWKIQISYYLNGEKKNPKELAGESGNLEIRISVKKNEKVKGDYFEDYLLQATVTLDSEKCKNIQAEGATLANVGADKQILYNIMAGQEKEFSITSEVTDFEMDGISFQGVPMSFAIDTDSLDMTALYEQTDELKEAVSRLDEGAGSLKEGTGELAKGSSRLLDATGSLAQGAVSLKTGTDGAASGSSSLVRGSQELETGIGTYLNGVSSAASGSGQPERRRPCSGSRRRTISRRDQDLYRGNRELYRRRPGLYQRRGAAEGRGRTAVRTEKSGRSLPGGNCFKRQFSAAYRWGSGSV